MTRLILAYPAKPQFCGAKRERFCPLPASASAKSAGGALLVRQQGPLSLYLPLPGKSSVYSAPTQVGPILGASRLLRARHSTLDTGTLPVQG